MKMVTLVIIVACCNVKSAPTFGAFSSVQQDAMTVVEQPQYTAPEAPLPVEDVGAEDVVTEVADIQELLEPVENLSVAQRRLTDSIERLEIQVERVTIDQVGSERAVDGHDVIPQMGRLKEEQPQRTP